MKSSRSFPQTRTGTLRRDTSPSPSPQPSLWLGVIPFGNSESDRSRPFGTVSLALAVNFRNALALGSLLSRTLWFAFLLALVSQSQGVAAAFPPRRNAPAHEGDDLFTGE